LMTVFELTFFPMHSHYLTEINSNLKESFGL
jgi:hypothetical protein